MFLLSNIALAQPSKLVSGPMFSYVDSYGTQVWFLLKSGANKIDIDIKDYENNHLLEYTFDVVNEYNLKEFPFTINLENLVPNMEYIVSVFIDGVFVKEMDLFTKRPHLDDVQFLIGSNLRYPSSKIFNQMIDTKSDFMVWLGGHAAFTNLTSCVKSKITTVKDMIESYIRVRKRPDVTQFISSTPQIATWGVSDYGALIDSPWSLKDSSHFVFDLFWPNSIKKTYNYTYFDYGTYQRYSYNDIDLFLLDSRTFISDSVLYGQKQIDRLFQEMQNTGSTFTIIASPVPFTFDTENSFLHYTEEYNYFLDKINLSELPGLILLSTSCLEINSQFDSEETHSLTRMNKYVVSKNLKNNQNNSIHEFQFSSLDSNTYSLINISGKKGNRTLSFETYNENGTIIYKKELHEDELQFN